MYIINYLVFLYRPGADELRHRYGIMLDKETMLIFNEEMSTPATQITVSVIRLCFHPAV